MYDHKYKNMGPFSPNRLPTRGAEVLVGAPPVGGAGGGAAGAEDALVHPVQLLPVLLRLCLGLFCFVG